MAGVGGTGYCLRALKHPTKITERYLRRRQSSAKVMGNAEKQFTTASALETDCQEEEGYTRRVSDSWDRKDLETLPEHLRPRKGETLDLILRQKVYLLQSRRGYRANVDSHMLAYFASNAYMRNHGVNDCKRPRVLDLGAGNGLVSVLFARAHTPSNLHLLELQPQLADRASRNLQLNDLHGKTEQHDLRDGNLPRHLHNSFDIILINPPFYPPGIRHPPRRREKLLAHMESSASIFDFLRAALDACDRMNPNAFIAVIYDIQQLPRLRDAMLSNNLQPCLSQEMHHTPEEESTRVLVQMKPSLNHSNGNSNPASHAIPIPTLPPLILHNHPSDNTYTGEIEAFLHNLPIPNLRIGRLRDVP